MPFKVYWIQGDVLTYFALSKTQNILFNHIMMFEKQENRLEKLEQGNYHLNMLFLVYLLH